MPSCWLHHTRGSSPGTARPRTSPGGQVLYRGGHFVTECFSALNPEFVELGNSQERNCFQTSKKSRTSVFLHELKLQKQPLISPVIFTDLRSDFSK